jgi:C4-type Zn-finger protein
MTQDTTRKGEVETAIANCPFCGSTKVKLLKERLTVDYVTDDITSVGCENCFARSGRVAGRSETKRADFAIAAWNSRATSNATYNEAISAAIEIASRHLIVGHAVGESVVKEIIAELVALKKGE